MLTASKLEKIIELEDNLKTQYQAQLDAKTAEIERLTKERDEQKAVIARQLETLTTLSSEGTASKRAEQLNRELTNRSGKLQDEVTELKKRVRTLQKDLAQEREEHKALKQFDPARMKKNLDENKKKLAERTSANELLQKSLSKTRTEKAELEKKVTELEARLAALEPRAEEQAIPEDEVAAA